MTQAFFTAAQLILYTTVVLALTLCAGDPDLIDAAVYRLMECP